MSFVFFLIFEGMFWNAGGFGYVIVLVKLGLKIKYSLYVTVSTKKVIEVGKSKKHIFLFKADFFHFFVKRLIFRQHQREAFVAAVNLI